MNGNIMWELFKVYGGTLTKTLEPCARILWLLRTMAKQVGVDCPIAELCLTMFRAKGESGTKRPKLKLKAADSRYILHLLVLILEKAAPRATQHDQIMYLAAWNLDQCYQEMKRWQPDTSPSLLQRHGRQSLILYFELAREARQKGDRYGQFWRIVPKMHLFVHCLEETKDNPQDGWNYKDESEIGHAAEICELLHPSTVHKQLIKRWRILPENCHS